MLGSGFVATASPASAKPLVQVTISLNCPSGVYSNLTNIALFDKFGNQIVPAGMGALECGTSQFGTAFGFGPTHQFSSLTRPDSYCWYHWSWEAPSNIAGVFTGLCGPGTNPIPNGRKPINATDVGGPAGLTFTVG